LSFALGALAATALSPTAFLFQVDSYPETKYHYYKDFAPAGTGTYKLWKEDCEANGCPGVYMVYQECSTHSCWLNFHCVKSYTGEPYDDC